VEALSTDPGAVSVAATKAVSPLLGAASYRHAVKQLLTSVVREICTLRSVGAGARATAPGHPVAISDGRPYRDLIERGSAGFQPVGPPWRSKLKMCSA
jgi:hypothetical protein